MAILSAEHDRAVQRLTAAVTEEERLTVRFTAALGTSAERSADVAVHAASQHVAARDAWLKWIDDASYRGLNAGPFTVHRQLDT